MPLPGRVASSKLPASGPAGTIFDVELLNVMLTWIGTGMAFVFVFLMTLIVVALFIGSLRDI